VDEKLARAIAAAARTFADELERNLPADDTPGASDGTPTAGSAESMVEVLQSVRRINHEENRGVTDSEMRTVAARAGMDPRGMAGYYAPAANLLEKRDDGSRWLTEIGEKRLAALQELLKLPSADAIRV